MRINKKDTIALVIDIQKKLFPFITDNDKLQSNVVKLIKGLKILDIEIITTEQYSKGIGRTIEPVLAELTTDFVFEKMSFSCCGIDNFNYYLKSRGKKNVIIAGIESHVCVLQTVLDLIEEGYQPVVINDCISSRNIDDKIIALERMKSAGAIISTTESILFEMLEVSGTETFKAISKIIK
jgi:nicotinamidase-related amidase